MSPDNPRPRQGRCPVTSEFNRGWETGGEVKDSHAEQNTRRGCSHQFAATRTAGWWFIENRRTHRPERALHTEGPQATQSGESAVAILGSARGPTPANGAFAGHQKGRHPKTTGCLPPVLAGDSSEHFGDHAHPCKVSPAAPVRGLCCFLVFSLPSV